MPPNTGKGQLVTGAINTCMNLHKYVDSQTKRKVTLDLDLCMFAYKTNLIDIHALKDENYSCNCCHALMSSKYGFLVSRILAALKHGDEALVLLSE